MDRMTEPQRHWIGLLEEMRRHLTPWERMLVATLRRQASWPERALTAAQAQSLGRLILRHRGLLTREAIHLRQYHAERARQRETWYRRRRDERFTGYRS